MQLPADPFSPPTAAVAAPPGSPRLSAVPEEADTEVSSISDTALIAEFGQVTGDSREPLGEAMKAILSEPKELAYSTKQELEGDVQLKEYWCGFIDSVNHEGYQCIQFFIDDELAESYFEMSLKDDEQAVIYIYATATKTTVMKRDTDILTKEEALEGAASCYA